MKLPIYKLVFVLVAVFTFYSCSQEDVLIEGQNENQLNRISQNVLAEAIFLNVPYGSHAQQSYDIYLPEGRSISRTKVIVLIHGGRWINGDKVTMEHYVTALQRSNPDHAIVNMNYVTAEYGVSYAFPNQFLDIQTLINFLKSHRFEYDISP